MKKTGIKVKDSRALKMGGYSTLLVVIAIIVGIIVNLLVAKIPSDLQQLNKRSVHRAMEIMGLREALRAGTEIQALAFHQPSAKAYFKKLASGPLTEALTARDEEFGDYRTSHGGDAPDKK